MKVDPWSCLQCTKCFRSVCQFCIFSNVSRTVIGFTVAKLQTRCLFIFITTVKVRHTIVTICNKIHISQHSWFDMETGVWFLKGSKSFDLRDWLMCLVDVLD